MRLFGLAVVVLWAGLACAQSMVARSIVFEGAPQFQPADLLALTGLKPGMTLTQPQIEAAMNKLDASGLFAGIQFKTSGSVLTFELEPKAGAAAERVGYTNFVWYTPEELTRAVHERVPLFTGSVPGDGDLAVKVQEALVAIVKEQHGMDVEVRRTAVSGGRVQFSIASPRVAVGDVRIENVDFASDPQLTAVKAGLLDQEYVEGLTQKQVEGNVAATLEDLGYLDQSVGSVSHGAPRVQRGAVLVDITGVAKPGPRYKVAQVTMPAPVGKVTAREFESEHAVKVGGNPSPRLVTNTVFGLTMVYERHGFLDAKVTVDPVKDTAAHTMSYTFKAEPGGVYRMRNLVFGGGMTAEQQSVLTQAWKLKKGDDYDGRLADLSLKEPQAAVVCRGPLVKMELVPDKATHEVDVDLQCSKRNL